MSDRDSFITCGLCSENVDKLIALPCFHTACSKCVEKIVGLTVQAGKPECPMCQKESSSRIADGASDVETTEPRVYLLNAAIRTSQVDCDACGLRHSAVYECKQCDQNFCNSCSSIHTRMTSSRFHGLVSILPIEKTTTGYEHVRTFCENHPSNEIATVCNDCDEFICIDCIPIFHKTHVCKSVSAAAEEKRNKLRELIGVSENNLTEIEKDTHVVKRQAESKYKYFNEQISELRRSKDSLITKVNQKYKSCEEKMKQLNDEQLFLSQQMNNVQNMTITNFQKTVEKSREVLETGDDISLLKKFESVCDELSVIKEELAPAVSGKTLMEDVERCTTWLLNLDKKCEEIFNSRRIYINSTNDIICVGQFK